MVLRPIHAVIDGVLTGSVYALMATGLTLIFGVMDIINVAQGIFVILGAYLSYALSVHWGIDLFVGLVITIPTLFVVGIVVERAFIGRLKGPEKTRHVDPRHLRGLARDRGRRST